VVFDSESVGLLATIRGYGVSYTNEKQKSI